MTDRLVSLKYLKDPPSLGARFSQQELIILMLSTLVAIFWYLANPIAFNADSPTYLMTAEYLTHFGGMLDNSTVYIRTIGYPLLLILGGYPLIKTLNGVLFYQLLMAMFFPLLFYRSLLYLTARPKFAFFGTVLSIITLLPYVHSKSINTEQLFLFLLLFSIYRIIYYYLLPNARNLKFVIGSLILLTLVRPSANLFFMICMVYSMIFLKRHYKEWIIGFCSFFIIMMCISAHFSLNVNPKTIGDNKTAGDNRILNTFIYHAYLQGLANPGPYTRFVKEGIQRYILSHPESLSRYEKTYQQTFLPQNVFTKDLEFFPQKMFEEPSIWYYSYIVDTLPAVIATDYSKHYSNFKKAWALEILKHNPKLLISFFKTYFLSAGSSFAGQMLFYHSQIADKIYRFEGKDPNHKSYPNTGPSNQTLYAYIKNYQSAINYQNAKNYQSAVPAKNSIIDITEKPSFTAVWSMWMAMDKMVTPPETSAYFMRAALENINQNKTLVSLMFLNNVFYFIFGSSSDFYHGEQRIGLLNPFPSDRDPNALHNKSILYSGLYEDLQKDSVFHISDEFKQIWSCGWTILKIISSFLILCGFGVMFRSSQSKPWLLVTLFWICHVLVCSIFGEPYTRYMLHIMPVALLLACTSMCSILELYDFRLLFKERVNIAK